MTKITSDTIDKLATLSRLEFDEKAKGEILNDLNKMLDFVSKLNELNTSNAEPLIYMNDERNSLRADETIHIITQKEALSNAPKKDSDYFKVPKVVEKNKNQRLTNSIGSFFSNFENSSPDSFISSSRLS